MNAQSVIALCPSTKDQVENFAAQLVSDVTEGVTNPLSLHLQIIAIQKALDIVKEKIKDDVLSEAEKYSQKSFSLNGCEITLKENGVKYDFTVCCDREWESAHSSELMFASLRKEREKFLKTLTKTEVLVHQETGEVIEVHPPIKTSTSGITVTLK